MGSGARVALLLLPEKGRGVGRTPAPRTRWGQLLRAALGTVTKVTHVQMSSPGYPRPQTPEGEIHFLSSFLRSHKWDLRFMPTAVSTPERTWVELFYKVTLDTSLVVQWLRLRAPNAGSPGSIPGQGTRSRMPQLKILHAPTKTRCSQINKYIYF